MQVILFSCGSSMRASSWWVWCHKLSRVVMHAQETAFGNCFGFNTCCCCETTNSFSCVLCMHDNSAKFVSQGPWWWASVCSSRSLGILICPHPYHLSFLSRCLGILTCPHPYHLSFLTLPMLVSTHVVKESEVHLFKIWSSVGSLFFPLLPFRCTEHLWYYYSSSPSLLSYSYFPSLYCLFPFGGGIFIWGLSFLWGFLCILLFGKVALHVFFLSPYFSMHVVVEPSRPPHMVMATWRMWPVFFLSM